MNKTLLALLVGIGVGILLAPDKGSETRRKLRGKFDDFKGDAEDQIDAWKDKGEAAYNKAKTKASDVMN